MFQDREIAEEKNKCKKKVKLCNSLKLFGCCKKNKCFLRHTLTKQLDILDALPNNGIIHFILLHIHDVGSISAQLLEHTDIEGNTTKMESLTEEINLKIKSSFESGRIYASNIRIRDWYVWEDNNKFRRCEVVAIIKKHKLTKEPSLVIIELIDLGQKHKVAVTDLYQLPQNLRNIPKQSKIHLILTYIVSCIFPFRCNYLFSQYCSAL